MPQKPLQSSQKVKYEGKYLQFIVEDGWEYVRRHNCTGIVIVVSMTDEGKVVLVEQYRPPVKGKVIEFPAGLINDQEADELESLESAAKRELFEETGYQAQRIDVLVCGPVSGGSSADTVTIVRAWDLKKTGPGGGDASEGIVVHEVELREVERWLSDREREGYLIEPKIYSGLYFLEKSS